MSEQTPSPKRVSDNEPHLSISAHVVVQLGEELVTDVEQALLELAKNAYDADSDFCRIEVDPTWEPAQVDQPTPEQAMVKGLKGRLIIRDNGLGIDPKSVAEGWLRISSSKKRSDSGSAKQPTTRGRTPVGDKGLGRLATMKIGRVLRLKTANAGENMWRTVTFSWDDFTQSRTLEEVPVHFGTDDSPVEEPGTTIEVLGLHHLNQWAQSAYVERHLIPKLSSLVNPFDSADNFEITVSTQGKVYELQSLDDNVLNLSSAKFEFEWDGSQLTETAHIASSLFRGERGDEGERNFNSIFGAETRPKLIAWLKSDKRLAGKGLTFDVAAPWFCKFSEVVQREHIGKSREFLDAKDPGPFTGNLFYFLFHQHVKEKLAQANLSAAALQSMSQVAIFRDGFRVRAQSDWLRLSESATSGSSYYGLRPSNVIGYFSVSNACNHELVEKSDREGFVDNPAYRGFMALSLRARDFTNSLLEGVRKSVKEFVRSQQFEGVPQDRRVLASSLRETAAATEKSLKNVQVSLDQIAQSSVRGDQDGNLSRSVDTIRETIRGIETQLARHTVESSLMSELSEDDRDYASRLLDAAAVGLVARTLSHELHQYIRELRGGIGQISAANKTIKSQDIARGERVIAGAIRELAKVVASIDPMLPGSRSLKEEFYLSDMLSEFASNREAHAKKAGVKLEMDIESASPLIIRFSRTRFQQILENLYQNSLYWLKAGPLPVNEDRRIEVRMTQRGLTWEDTGPGVRPSLEGSIFDAYVSDKPGSEASGLGLHVVSTFLELEQCSIKLAGKRNRFGRISGFEIDLSGARSRETQKSLGL